ncbi:MAG: hypothetical protein WD468_06745 [Pirellulales bacterium]
MIKSPNTAIPGINAISWTKSLDEVGNADCLSCFGSGLAQLHPDPQPHFPDFEMQVQGCESCPENRVLACLIPAPSQGQMPANPRPAINAKAKIIRGMV